MPALKQINKEQSSKKFKISRRLILKIVFLILVALGVFLYKNMPSISVIPEKIYATRSDGYFKTLFDTPIKKVIWFGADCAQNIQKRVNINRSLKYMQLDNDYKQKAFLQNSLLVNCQNCMDSYIMDNCADDYCIIVPESRRIIKVKSDDLFRDLERYKNL